ncbi:MAG: ribonucleoside-diphosphate reductase [Armatimonadetes bacterium]|nr:ribonucleoside-diphosphate reductase [Armatimonadota bacterium]
MDTTRSDSHRVDEARSDQASGDEAPARNRLNELGEKIFLDRYALKDASKRSLAVGDVVVVCTDVKTGQREIGTIADLQDGTVTVRLRDGSTLQRAVEHIDKPLETRPEEMMARVARGIAAVEGPKAAEWEQRFRWLLDDWKFVPAGRILTAAGTDQQLTYYNCYVVPSPRDSRKGIVDTLSAMMEIMSRGGGVGINLSSLRPRHSYVRGVNGRSSGSVSWGGLYSFVTGLIEQGGSRRGALMLILNVWHPDVLDFITAKREAGKITNANISVGITDDFMAAVEADREWELVFPDTSDPEFDTRWDGDLDAWRAAGKPVVVHKTRSAREIWNAIIESAWASAEPGVFFVDRYNRMSNSWYYAPILCTNPCVTAETLVATSRGLERIGDLAMHPEVDVALDERLSPERRFAPAADVFRTGVKPVYRLRTAEGYTVRLTGDHRVRTDRGWVRADALVPGDRVHLQMGGGGFGRTGTRELGEVLGWLVGDGTIKANEAVLSFFGEEKRELAPAFAEKVNRIVAGMEKANRPYPVSAIEVAGRDEARVGGWRLWRVANEFGLVGDKLKVPERLFTASREMQAGFLAALFTADGQVNDSGEKGCSVRLSSKSEGLLLDVQRLLLNFGIASTLYRNRKPERMAEMPDGKGGHAFYRAAAYHDLVISKDNLTRFAEEIGFLLRRKQDALQAYLERCTRGPYREDYRATFQSLEYEGEEEVYDLTEPLTHSFVANGIVVHNCGEQGLPSWGVCNLGAINLSRFVKDGEVDWEPLGQAVRYAVRFLDDVIDATPYFFTENETQQKSERRVGLNTMGLAEMLIRLGIRYGSAESEKFIDRLYEFIAREAYRAAAELAAEKGAFPKFDAEKFLQSGYMKRMPEDVRALVAEKGVRNVTLLTQAPNGTIGTMVGTSTGIEPYFSWTYFRKSRLGVHEENVEIVREWQELNPGEPLPDFFVTAMDLTPEEHVRVQAAVQRWIDSSISKTCNVPNNYTVAQTRELYELMYRLGCKGGTIYRDGSRDEQVLLRKEASEKPAAAPAVAEQPKVRPRPYKRYGVTVSKKTPAGTAHITMNNDAEGRPFEVFVDIGKGGTDVKAMAEAIGRLMSLVLRIASPLSPLDRIREMVNQMKGIGGARWIGFGRDRVRSLPDAVAQALEEHYGVEGSGNGHPVPDELASHETEPPVGVAADLCPACGQAAFIHEEGCMTCHACGHSEC